MYFYLVHLDLQNCIKKIKLNFCFLVHLAHYFSLWGIFEYKKGGGIIRIDRFIFKIFASIRKSRGHLNRFFIKAYLKVEITCSLSSNIEMTAQAFCSKSVLKKVDFCFFSFSLFFFFSLFLFFLTAQKCLLSISN